MRRKRRDGKFYSFAHQYIFASLRVSLLNQSWPTLLWVRAAPATLPFVRLGCGGNCGCNSRWNCSKTHLDTKALNLCVILIRQCPIRRDHVRVVATDWLLLRRGRVSRTVVWHWWRWVDLAIGIGWLNANSDYVGEFVSWLALLVCCLCVWAKVNAGGERKTCEFAIPMLSHLRHCGVLADTINGVFFDQFA